MQTIEIYTKGYCPYCAAAKKRLHDLGWKYQEYEITGKPKKQQEMIARSKRRTVPQIFINKHHIGGYDDFSAHLQKIKPEQNT